MNADMLSEDDNDGNLGVAVEGGESVGELREEVSWEGVAAWRAIDHQIEHSWIEGLPLDLSAINQLS